MQKESKRAAGRQLFSCFVRLYEEPFHLSCGEEVELNPLATQFEAIGQKSCAREIISLCLLCDILIPGKAQEREDAK